MHEHETVCPTPWWSVDKPLISLYSSFCHPERGEGSAFDATCEEMSVTSDIECSARHARKLCVVTEGCYHFRVATSFSTELADTKVSGTHSHSIIGPFLWLPPAPRALTNSWDRYPNVLL